MKQIVFNRTSNIFINSGIIALNYYLEEFKNKKDCNYKYEFNLKETSLEIECDELYSLLEDIYYLMGKEMYDTSGKKARKKQDKYYFIEEPFEGVPFYKMKSYGVAGFITNDPAPTASQTGESINFDNLYKNNNSFALRIAKFLSDKNKKLKFYDFNNGKIEEKKEYEKGKRESNNGGESKIFINDEYTKTTSLPKFDENYFKTGDLECSLTGEKFKKIIEIKNSSPFIASLDTFESFTKNSTKKISWDAMYLSRFSPKLGLYSYVQGLDYLQCYFFESENLLDLNEIYKNNRSFYKLKDELIECNYMSNFNLYNFYKSKNEDKDNVDYNDFTERSEILFMLIYTFYRQCLLSNSNNEIETPPGLNFESTPNVSLVSFSAKKFVGTMRPDAYEVFNNFKYIIRFIELLEEKVINLKVIFSTLKFLKQSDKENANKYRLERKIRNKIIDNILNKKSIISDIEHLMYNFYSVLTTGGNLNSYKDFKQITKLVNLYESIIKYGGNEKMNEEIQKKAINLGSSISIGISKFENGNEKENARNGRKYVIGLSRARTLKQFLTAIERIENKYHIVLTSGLLESLKEENWEYIKQFCIVSALSNLNQALLPKNKKQEEK